MTLLIDCPHCMHPDGHAFESVIVPAYSLSTGGGGGGDVAADAADADDDAADRGLDNLLERDTAYAEPRFPDTYIVQCQCTDSSHDEGSGCGRTGRVPTRTLP